MKILHSGNMANLAYLISKQLRYDGIDVDLLVDLKQSDPLKLDPELNGHPPHWFIFYDRSKSGWKRFLLKIMRDNYDLIHAYAEHVIFAYISRKPFLANTQGSDLRQLAFTNSIRGFLLRRGYRKAKLVLISQPDHFPLLKKLKIKNAVYLPTILDLSLFKPKKISRTSFKDKLIIFHPGNLLWRGKGNDIIVKGFANYVKQNTFAHLIIIDRGQDSKKTHDLINSLGIEKFVEFIPGPLNKQDLEYYYNLCDIVLDQVKAGSLGAIALESMACEKPVIIHIKENEFRKVYDKLPPVLNANSINEVEQKLEILSDKEKRQKIGKEGRQWVINNHSSKIVSEKLRVIYELVLQKKDISEIRQSISQKPLY